MKALFSVKHSTLKSIPTFCNCTEQSQKIGGWVGGGGGMNKYKSIVSSLQPMVFTTKFSLYSYTVIFKCYHTTNNLFIDFVLTCVTNLTRLFTTNISNQLFYQFLHGSPLKNIMIFYVFQRLN